MPLFSVSILVKTASTRTFQSERLAASYHRDDAQHALFFPLGFVGKFALAMVLLGAIEHLIRTKATHCVPAHSPIAVALQDMAQTKHHEPTTVHQEASSLFLVHTQTTHTVRE